MGAGDQQLEFLGAIQQLLFGDILGISWSDLTVIAVLSLGVLIYLAPSACAPWCC
jgi:zinc transport system permease protein